MPGETLTSFDYALKEYYTDSRVIDMVYKRNPWLAMCPKREDFYGDLMPIPTIYGNPQGVSNTFSTAQTNKTPSQGVKFNLTRARKYGLVDIDNETLLASQSQKGAWLEARVVAINGVINALSRQAAVAMYRDSGGAIGQIGTVSTDTITLTDISEITNFEVNMELVASANLDGSSPRTGSATVTQVDRGAGQLVSDSNWSSQITSIAANDYLFIEGSIAAEIEGLSGWIPASAPTSTAFFGVDRSVDTDRLGGNRVTGTNQPIEEAIIEGASRAGREGGEPDCCFLNFEKYSDLEKSLGSKVQYIEVQATANVMFPGIRVNGPSGVISVFPDRNAQPDVAWLLQKDTWVLASLGPVPRVLNADGLQMLRLSSSDGVEARWGMYYNLGCRAPGFNTRVSLS